MKYVTFTMTLFALAIDSDLYDHIDNDRTNAFAVCGETPEHVQLEGLAGEYPTRMFREISKEQYLEARGLTHSVVKPDDLPPMPGVGNGIAVPVKCEKGFSATKSVESTADVSSYLHYGVEFGRYPHALEILRRAGIIVVAVDCVDIDLSAEEAHDDVKDAVGKAFCVMVTEDVTFQKSVEHALVDYGLETWNSSQDAVSGVEHYEYNEEAWFDMALEYLPHLEGVLVSRGTKKAYMGDSTFSLEQLAKISIAGMLLKTADTDHSIVLVDNVGDRCSLEDWSADDFSALSKVAKALLK